MTIDLARSGVIYLEELERHRVYPCEDRLKMGPVAIIECIQEIPCDPCVHSCPQKAISLRNLSAIPELDREKCVGCALCISSCPGLAIFVVDMTYSEDEALVFLPYEFLPLPKVGEQVEVVDREGNPKAKGRLVKVRNDAGTNHTAVLAIAVAKDVALEVRSIRSRRR